MYLYDYNEHLHNCILLMLTGKDKAEYKYNFEKYFSVYRYGEVGYRPIETKREITNECINYMEHLLELLSSHEEFDQYLLGKLSDEIEFLKLNVIDNDCTIHNKDENQIIPQKAESNNSESKEIIPNQKKEAKETTSFRSIIQYEDPDKLLNRLHQLIDGRSGADVGCVLLKAYQENYIGRKPTKKEFKSEFELIGSWTAITNYLNENSLKALARANRIVIFE